MLSVLYVFDFVLSLPFLKLHGIALNDPVCFLSAARKSLSPVLDGSDAVVVKRRSAEELDKELRGGDAAVEPSLHPKEVLVGAEGQYNSSCEQLTEFK